MSGPTGFPLSSTPPFKRSINLKRPAPKRKLKIAPRILNSFALDVMPLAIPLPGIFFS